MPEPSGASLVERGRAAFEARAWADAYDAFRDADASEPLEVADLERYARAAGLLARDSEMIAVFERAHDLRVAAGELERGAQVAFWIGFRLSYLGEMGRSGGWLEQAAKLVERLGEPTVVEGYLLLPGVLRCLAAGKVDEAAAIATRVGEIATRFDDVDLLALGQSVLGRVLLRKGELERGLALLDHSMLTASRGAVSSLTTGLVYCAAISNCARIFALDRAREWTQALARFCEAQPQLVTFGGTCLVHCSEVHQVSGDWEEAEREALRAAESVPEYVPAHVGPVGDALYQRAELKRLRGEFDEAEALYRGASERGREPQPGLALLRLWQGNRDAAAIAVRRVLGTTKEQQSRLVLLPAGVEVLLAVGVLEEARALVEELEASVAQYPTDVLRAMAAHARGSLSLAEGDPAAAVGSLRVAFEIWQRLAAPYLAARLRVELGRAYDLLGDGDGAALERGAARSVFESLGAKHDLTRLVADGAPAKQAATPGGLTPREVEVLKLVASGMTNRQIAERLFLSEKTIDRHLSNIFVKLDVSSRAAATAFAFQRGLV